VVVVYCKSDALTLYVNAHDEKSTRTVIPVADNLEYYPPNPQPNCDLIGPPPSSTTVNNIRFNQQYTVYAGINTVDCKKQFTFNGANTFLTCPFNIIVGYCVAPTSEYFVSGGNDGRGTFTIPSNSGVDYYPQDSTPICSLTRSNGQVLRRVNPGDSVQVLSGINVVNCSFTFAGETAYCPYQVTVGYCVAKPPEPEYVSAPENSMTGAYTIPDYSEVLDYSSNIAGVTPICRYNGRVVSMECVASSYSYPHVVHSNLFMTNPANLHQLNICPNKPDPEPLVPIPSFSDFNNGLFFLLKFENGGG
jgi:hypothetical protein